MNGTTSAPERPTVGAPAPWTFPQPRSRTLDSGLEFATFDVPGQHVVSVRVVVPAPLAAEPRDLEGVGTILARVLDEGTRSHPVEEMAGLLERGGVSVRAGVGERGLVVDLEVPARRLQVALDLLRQILLEPALGEAEVRRHVRSRLVEIDQERAAPGMRAALEFAARYYDPSSRVSRPTAGARQTVQAITADAVRAYHEQILTPRGAGIVIAGDLSEVGDVDALVEGTFGAWDEGATPPPAPVAARRDEGDRIVLVDRPGSVQTEFYLGAQGPDRRVAGGWAPFPVVAYLVGGAPQARLDAVLREERGYTYGMRASARPRVGQGVFLVSGSVRSEVTADALGLTLDILDAAREGFEEAETAAGVDFLSRTAPGRYATADALADEAAARLLDGLGTTHSAQVLAQTADLAADDLTAAYRDHVVPQWTTVLVADASAMADEVEALGRAQVEVVADDGPRDR